MALVVDPDGIELPTIRGLVDLAGLDVLEVGCGEGRMTFGCAEDARSVLAFDADEELVEAARRATPRALRDVAAEGLHLLEEPFGDDLLHAVVHRLDDGRELAGVDEAEPAPAGAHGEVEAERVDVEEEALRP